MAFIGGWRSRRRRYGGPAGYGGPGYGPPGYRPYQRSGCARDLCLVESGCCLAELLGCGPQLAFLAPSLVRRSARAARLAGPDEEARPWLLRFLLAAIGLYQREISPRRRPCCRFSPSCSHYAAQALEVHGLRRGSWLAFRRLVRCRPGTAGGLDPVPAP